MSICSQIMKRFESRKLFESFHLACEMIKIINHFFPNLINLLKQVKDPRNKSYTIYGVEIILTVRIFAAIFQISSMRGITNEFNTEAAIENIKIVTGNTLIDELPHYSTINNFLEDFENEELEKIIHEMVVRLIKTRSFENSRIRNKYWQVVVDGTQLYSSDKRHCEHCLTRTHNKGKENESVEYYHMVLEAKLVLFDDIVISIGTEFIENNREDNDATDSSDVNNIDNFPGSGNQIDFPDNISKQDCELKAFYRLAEKIKKLYPRLPILITVDSLYACDNFFNICEKNNWAYILRFKDGSIKSVAKDFSSLKNEDINNIHMKELKNGGAEYKYVTDIQYGVHKFNMIEYEETTLNKMNYSEKRFVYITSLSISEKNYESVIVQGRRRWLIENQGFNEQKEHGFFITHLFSKNYNAMKNHYLLIQIAHIIAQLIENFSNIIKQIKLSTKYIFDKIKKFFTSKKITPQEYSNATVKFYIHMDKNADFSD